jgi:GNAT superfamily N-acetyltransferase
MRVEEATTLTADLVAALGHLVGQLSGSAPTLTEGGLRQIIDSPATRLLIARDEQESIVGSLTLAVFRIPTGVRAWIEDVVVDEAARGQGVGEALSTEAVRHQRLPPHHRSSRLLSTYTVPNVRFGSGGRRERA